jgi:hypothetical protein
VSCCSCTRWVALIASAAVVAPAADIDEAGNWTGHWSPRHRKALPAVASGAAAARHAAAAPVEDAAGNIH